MGEENKQEVAKKITQEIVEADNLAELEAMLQRNVIEFELEKITYRVRKPTIKERQEVRKYKNKKYFELLNDDNYLFKAQIIKKLLEKKGIDINEMDNEMLKIQEQINRLELSLAEHGKEKEQDNKIITDLKLKIYELIQERNLISIKKSDLLAGNIEDELLENESTYCAYLVLEKKENDNWVKVFNTYDDFINSKDEKLMAKVGHYLGLLLFSFSDNLLGA